MKRRGIDLFLSEHVRHMMATLMSALSAVASATAPAAYTSSDPCCASTDRRPASA